MSEELFPEYTEETEMLAPDEASMQGAKGLGHNELLITSDDNKYEEKEKEKKLEIEDISEGDETDVSLDDIEIEAGRVGILTLLSFCPFHTISVDMYTVTLFFCDFDPIVMHMDYQTSIILFDDCSTICSHSHC